VAVLGAWAIGLGLLLARELNPSPAARLAEVALRIVPITTYYTVERSGLHIGFASIAIDTVPKALQVTEYVVTDSMPGVRHTDQLMVRLSRGLALREFETTTTLGSDTSRVSGRVTDSTLVVTTPTRTDTQPIGPASFAGIIGATVTVLLGEPRVGAASLMQVIDPASGALAPRETRVMAESLFVVIDSAVADSSGRWFAVHKDTVRAWRLVADAPALDAWIDAQGLVVEARLANGLQLRRTAFELAFENWRLATPDRAVSARGNGSVVSGTWLASGATPPTAVVDTLTIELGSAIPREFTQRFGRGFRAGNQVTYATPTAANLRSRYVLPTTAAWQKVFAKELMPGPFIESEDPAIAQRAARLAGRDTDPTAIARRIVRWVADSLRARVPAKPTTAAGALAARSGDAREYALLTTGLLRAAGIPAQPVTGLLQHNGRFYLHSWTEVYLGRWLAVDAMLDQFPADASHLWFLTGAADPGPDVARILTRLDIRVRRTVVRPELTTDVSHSPSPR
jgi:hypothetical protein